MSAPIPEDAKKGYDAACAILSIEGMDEPWVALYKREVEKRAQVEAEREMWKAEASRLECDKKHIIELGERELAQARETIKRLSAPVSDEEHDRYFNENVGGVSNPEWAAKCEDVNALIAARAKESQS